MTVARTFRFPAGSVILYSHPNKIGELVLYSKKTIAYKTFGIYEDLENKFNDIIQEIEDRFVEVAKDVLRDYIIKDVSHE